MTSSPTTNPERDLISNARYEVIPLKNLESEIPHIPTAPSGKTTVSVTCSPVKGLQATLDLTARLTDLGHNAVPHISARLTEDDVAVKRLAEFCRRHGLREVFLVAGDATTPVGKYEGVVDFLRDFLQTDHGLRAIGVTAYPDGHALIDSNVLHEALHAKQAMLAQAGVPGYATTQMCFDVTKWRAWVTAERAAGFTLPLHIGVPGVIDRVKLVTMGMRLGVGASLRYVQKNGSILGRLFSPTGYNPRSLIGPLAEQADEFNIDGIHLFTFNNVQATAKWQQKVVSRLA